MTGLDLATYNLVVTHLAIYIYVELSSMKKGRGLSVGVLLLLGLLALQASAQAPGDEQLTPCNSSGALNLAHTYPNEWNLLMDSFNYRTLVSVDPVTPSTPQAQRPVWQLLNSDGTGVGVRYHSVLVSDTYIYHLFLLV